METRFIKDLAIALIFIILFAFAVKDYTVYNKVTEIPNESIYTDISVNEELLEKIRSIETSIEDRKNFTFYVPTDPLRQDPVIKDRLDREQEWANMVANMIRVAAIFHDEDNQKCAIIAHKGRSSIYRIGDTITGTSRRITDIQEGQVIYNDGGYRGVMPIQPIPPRPVDLETSSNITDYNY